MFEPSCLLLCCLLIVCSTCLASLARVCALIQILLCCLVAFNCHCFFFSFELLSHSITVLSITSSILYTTPFPGVARCWACLLWASALLQTSTQPLVQACFSIDSYISQLLSTVPFCSSFACSTALVTRRDCFVLFCALVRFPVSPTPASPFWGCSSNSSLSSTCNSPDLLLSSAFAILPQRFRSIA